MKFFKKPRTFKIRNLNLKNEFLNLGFENLDLRFISPEKYYKQKKNFLNKKIILKNNFIFKKTFNNYFFYFF